MTSSSLKAKLTRLEAALHPKEKPLLTWLDIIREGDEPLDLSRYANGEDFAALFADVGVLETLQEDNNSRKRIENRF